MASRRTREDAGDAAPAGVPEVVLAGEMNRMIQSEVRAIYERLERLRHQAKFPSFAPVNVPMVLVLGNHSSGKSTFINYMLQQDVQKTGRAPTDCTFTVMVGGPRAERLDGAALVRHAKYGFNDVQRQFGRAFVSQIELKVVADSPLLDHGGLMLVDSPGMIDPPGASADRTDQDRGYDFKRVVQWFADRADVILVMFDPDKPGTTFETLDVLTSSLRELSSKVLLILNKVDDFQTVHDFARAYGALCWNLSKVIPRKDLPFIYTMYVPQDQRDAAPRRQNPTARRVKPPATPSNDDDGGAGHTNGNAASRGVQRMLEHEFDGTRGEVVREVERAPDRATDNVLNLLKATASRLKMHVTLVDACRQEYADLKTFWKRAQIAGAVAGVGLVAFYLIRTVGRSSALPIESLPTAKAVPTAPPTSAATAGGRPAPSPSTTGPSSSSASASTSTPTSSKPNLRGASSAGKGSDAWQSKWAREVAKAHSPFRYATFFKLVLSSCAANLAIWKTSLLRLEGKREQILQWLPATFERVYAQYLCKSDRTHDETVAQWNIVRPGLELALTASPIDQFPPFELADKSYLDDVLALHIPRLDRCVRDRSGDDHAYLRFKHLDKPSAKAGAGQESPSPMAE
ncbi:hypothetical protein P43SY_008988 [Pythium insidiosum]|uniref:Dynamin N-terminal domain-containing protein n=1 Tax=Pythium insidiosum TaxID=114742 RepID=A0AAD5LC36_PYTIN|nr:hypothetical protein P43SY_008988 [Pythium insidiosum]